MKRNRIDMVLGMHLYDSFHGRIDKNQEYRSCEIEQKISDAHGQVILSRTSCHQNIISNYFKGILTAWGQNLTAEQWAFGM
ncbi:hypothetical protein L5515_015308 [Caenorhabditis briggsae]|uniref:Uncharacterized protein n=1 Tax=Caenorhabditis briggsae TaxID=6238 RepID=A0AAE9EEL5_CAEBR|nr:hypothetical protein L5515_015308 [Caenorhabditis briggsae]